jgi:hypothetical protein
MHRLVDRTTRRGVRCWDVVDDTEGRLLGRITQSRAARHGRAFFAALGPDQCDLGRHPTIELAIDAVVADAKGGWPRSPRNPKERYRELYDSPAPPLYPLTAGAESVAEAHRGRTDPPFDGHRLTCGPRAHSSEASRIFHHIRDASIRAVVAAPLPRAGPGS